LNYKINNIITIDKAGQKGIKISFEAKFEEFFPKKSFQQHPFTYYISIEK